MRQEEPSSQSSGRETKKENDLDNVSRLTSSAVPKVELSQNLVVEEVMIKLQSLLDQKPKDTLFQRFSTHPLFLLLAGVALSGVAGGIIGTRVAYNYSIKQQEVTAERSFSDELNRLRIQKLSEVWERLDEDEGAIDRLLNQPDDKQNPEGRNLRAKEIDKLIQEDRRTVDRHRFWLGAQSSKIHGYLDASSLYAIKKLIGSESDLETLLKQRKYAKSDLDTARDEFLKSNVDRAKQASSCYLF
jgi:hypothetical protein